MVVLIATKPDLMQKTIKYYTKCILASLLDTDQFLRFVRVKNKFEIHFTLKQSQRQKSIVVY